MKKKIVKKSEVLLGEPYMVIPNKFQKQFFCHRCRRTSCTSVFYYPIRDNSYLICANCYGEMSSAAIRKIQIEAPLLPRGTTVFLGRKKHRCGPYVQKVYKEVFYKVDAELPTTVCLYQCTNCGRLFLKGNKYNARTFANYKIVPSTRIDETRSSMFSNSRGNIRIEKHTRRDIASTEFLTRTTIGRCSSSNHLLEDIEIAIKVMHPNYTVTNEVIPASYCHTCNRIYLLESEFQTLRNKGILLCNVVEEYYWSSSVKSGFYIKNSESLLHKMGYNVNANIGLTKAERCAILRAAVENDLLTKTEIISHLDYLIRRSSHQTSLSDAVEKWKKDREYIRGYSKGDTGTCYEARTIVHKSPVKRREDL